MDDMIKDVIEDVKTKIQELSSKHSILNEEIDSMALAEEYEIQAQMMILEYCLNKKYAINGFLPTLLSDDDEFEDVNTYFEKLGLYLDLLSLEKEDVADLWLYYHSVFWPDFIETKSEMIERIKQQVSSGKFYSVEI
jgi:hypothetical protein